MNIQAKALQQARSYAAQCYKAIPYSEEWYQSLDLSGCYSTVAGEMEEGLSLEEILTKYEEEVSSLMQCDLDINEGVRRFCLADRRGIIAVVQSLKKSEEED